MEKRIILTITTIEQVWHIGVAEFTCDLSGYFEHRYIYCDIHCSRGLDIVNEYATNSFQNMLILKDIIL